MSINESSTTTTNNTIVLITGGNTGIGLAIAQALLSAPIEPYSIIVTSRSIERATAAIKGLYNDPTFKDAFSSGSEALPMQLDVDDDESVKAVRQRIGEKFGRVDVLVNNAGTSLADLTTVP
jgi:NAD(P)-dependent dehydrogenase (short-subunit alcohol dehydrogenase family)